MDESKFYKNLNRAQEQKEKGAEDTLLSREEFGFETFNNFYFYFGTGDMQDMTRERDASKGTDWFARYTEQHPEIQQELTELFDTLYEETEARIQSLIESGDIQDDLDDKTPIREQARIDFFREHHDKLYAAYLAMRDAISDEDLETLEKINRDQILFT